MLKFDLQLTPYKVSIMQHPKEADVRSCPSFANLMTPHNDVVDKLWFTQMSVLPDVATFTFTMH